MLFRVGEVGVCGTDLELAAFSFGFPPAGSGYMVLGHEAAGQVVACGPDATGFTPGDSVVPMVRRPCSPPCRSCAAGRRDLCLTGGYTERGIFGAHGYFTELAVDHAADLVRVPAAAAPFAVLLEPLSVVEKAVAEALRLHRGGAASALVIGAGTIGILAALVLRERGLSVTIRSIEPEGSPRARLAAAAGAAYTAGSPPRADIVIEAAGAPSAAATGLAALAPLGVMIVLGAARLEHEFPLLDLIVNNQTVAGVVNAGPEHFRLAAEHIARFPQGALDGLIRREPFGAWRRSFTPAARYDQPKTVHHLAGR